MVVTPRNYAEMKNQLVIFMFVTHILFWENSIIPLALISLYNAMLKYSSELKHKFKTNKLLPTKTLYAVDQEVQRRVKENRTAKLREIIVDDIVEDLPRVIVDIIRHRFSMELPGILKFGENNADADVPSGPATKKLKYDDTQKTTRYTFLTTISSQKPGIVPKS